MDIKITHSSLKSFLDTTASMEDIINSLSSCGPTVDRFQKKENDYIFEIEAITNRVDTASVQGVAREAATILPQFGIPAKMINDPYLEAIDFRQGFPKQFHFNILNDELLIRFTAVSLSHVNIESSPENTQKFLSNCDERSINNAVDITNELTLLYGMPSHIFDLDKLAAQELNVRESKDGEEITTLDNKKNKLKDGDIVIEDGNKRLVDLCGIMGGTVAEVDDHTKNILLIIPICNPKKVRKTSLHLQKRTLAAQLFEKQPDPELSLPVLSKAIQLFKERAGAEVSSEIFDYYPKKRSPKTVPLDLDWLDTFTGVTLPKDKIISILSGLGFSVKSTTHRSLSCTVPSWRYQDINIKEDLAEEIVRIYGYFRLPSVLPTTTTSPEKNNPLLTAELKAKNYLSHIGYNEIYNYSLVSKDLLESSGLDIWKPIKLSNSLSIDYEYLRTSLIPSLLQNLRNNQGKTEGTIRIFEISNCYHKQDNKDLPDEVPNLCLLTTLDYRRAQGDLEALFKILNTPNITFRSPSSDSTTFDDKQSSDILINDFHLGRIGKIKPQILRNFGISISPVVVELNFKALNEKINTGYTYRPISEYPEMIESITIETNHQVGEIIQKILLTDPLITNVQYMESYENKHTFKVSFGSQERNLDQSEVNQIKEKILTASR